MKNVGLTSGFRDGSDVAPEYRLHVGLTESRGGRSRVGASASEARTVPRTVRSVCACVGAGSFILPRISIDRLQFTNAETCWIYRHSATLSLRNPLPSVIFSFTRRAGPRRLSGYAPRRSAPRRSHFHPPI